MARKKKSGEHVQRIYELCDAAWELDHGPAQVALLEEAVQIADAHNDVDLAYEVRHYLIDAATFGGSPDIALVAFAWCVSRADEDSQRFDPEPLYWKYKWIATAAPKFPTIPREQIHQLLDDMHQRYVAAGIGLHPFYQTRRNVYLYMGDIAAAQQDHEQVLRHERNHMSDCIACEQDSAVRLHLESGHFPQAETAAKPILEKRLRCAEVPHRTYAMLLLPLLENNASELAKSYHRAGLRLIKVQPGFLQEAALHILFLTITDNLPAAVRLTQRYLPLYAACRCPAWRFDFERVLTFVCQRLAQTSPSLRLRWPNDFPLPEGLNPRDYLAIAQHLRHQAEQLAQAFDTRNANNYYHSLLDQLDTWPQRLRPLPL
jgi:hypothetical protein